MADALAAFPEPAKEPLRALADRVAQEGMAGALDQTTPPSLARELAAKISGARFLEIPGCGHCPQIEQPQAFVDAVNGFLPG